MATQPLSEQFRVQLPAFEGPLDLLLFFIKRDELDIYDIPISKITRDFLNYITMMRTLNIRLAGDFMVIAATLMRIKARMLLPVSPDEDDEAEDPRMELVQMLIEYRRFKEAAAHLEGRETENITMFPRRQSMEAFYGGPEVEDSLAEVTLFDLLNTVRKILAEMPEEQPHDVELFDVTLEEQMGVIMGFFGERKEYPFMKLASTLKRKIAVVVTFMALLELIRQRKVGVHQKKFYGEIMIRKVSNG